MSNHITTYGGTHFYPTAPEQDKIHVTDIAHALSLICRGNGHVKTFFSVGQHCINCALEAEARGYSNRVILACLLHDAGEAYMSDVPRPFKQYLGEYLKFEDQLLDVIYEKYLGSVLTEDEAKKVKEIDDDLLCYDLVYLLSEDIGKELPGLRISFTYDEVPFEAVEKQFLALFTRISQTLPPVLH